MSKVIEFTGDSRLDKNADRELEKLIGKLDGFVISGYTKDGGELFLSTFADGGTTLWLIERLKKQLLENGDAE